MKFEQLIYIIDTFDYKYKFIWDNAYSIVKAIGDICYKNKYPEFATALICSFVHRIDVSDYSERGIHTIKDTRYKIDDYINRVNRNNFDNNQLTGNYVDGETYLKDQLRIQLNHHMVDHVEKLEKWSKMGG
jgi:hypothetical protein